MSSEDEGKYNNNQRSQARTRQARTAKAAPTSAGRHRFAAPQLDEDEDRLDDDTDDEQQMRDTRRRQDEEDDGSNEFDSRSANKHNAVYPQISARTERQLAEKKPTARRIAMDDGDETEEDGQYQLEKARQLSERERSSSTARNDQPAAATRKRFVAQHDDDDDEQLTERPQQQTSLALLPLLADSSPAYLVTPSLLFTPGTHTSPSADPALLMAQALATLPSPPASTTGLATRVPGVTERLPRYRRAFRAGWGVDGKISLIRGSSVTMTRVKGDEQNSTATADELERERQGRVAMMVAMLEVHHDFADKQKAGQHGASTSLSSPRSAPFVPASSLIPSTSPIAMLCDLYIAKLSALLVSHPAIGAATSTSLVPARPFSVASQLRHAISVFQLVKVLYAPEYGSASLSSFLSTPPSTSLLPALSSDFPSQSLSPAASPFDEMYARLHHLKEYFKQQLAPLTPVPSLSLSAATTAYPPLLSLLSSYQITEATELALSTRHLRLATLLPSLSSTTAELTAMCASQVSEWQNTGVWDVMAEEEKKCFLLLAGHKQADDMHWLRGLAMHVCYQIEGDGSVVKGVHDYQRAVEDGKAQPALPPYKYEPPIQRKERRRIIVDDEDDEQMQITTSSSSRGRATSASYLDTRSDEHHTTAHVITCGWRMMRNTFDVQELRRC